MFYWAQYTTHEDGFEKRPLIFWHQASHSSNNFTVILSLLIFFVRASFFPGDFTNGLKAMSSTCNEFKCICCILHRYL